MTLHDQYDEAVAAWHTVRSAVLSDRLTLSRKIAQMHDADVEQDEDVADYFAGRKAEMEQQVAAGEAQMAALAAQAEELRISMVSEELQETIASYDAALRALESHLAELHAQAAQAALLSRRAEALVETLPAAATKQRETTARLVSRTEAIQAAVQHLEAVLASVGAPEQGS